MVVIAKSLLCSFGVGVPAHPCMFTSVVLCSLLRWYVLKCDYYALCVALHICLNFKHPFQLLFLIKTWRMALCLHKEYLQIMIQLIQLYVKFSPFVFLKFFGVFVGAYLESNVVVSSGVCRWPGSKR